MTYTEDALVEQPAIKLFADFEWETLNCWEETFVEESLLGREHSGEVILRGKLFPALQALNPEAPDEALNQAIEELTHDRSLRYKLAKVVR